MTDKDNPLDRVDEQVSRYFAEREGRHVDFYSLWQQAEQRPPVGRAHPILAAAATIGLAIALVLGVPEPQSQRAIPSLVQLENEILATTLWQSPTDQFLAIQVMPGWQLPTVNWSVDT